MSRDHARINLDIWGDDDWLDLPPAAQHLYLVLYTSPSLSFCGAGEWHPGKIAQRAHGWTAADVVAAVPDLLDGQFILIDTDTDEFLVRSWIKHDRLYRVQNMAVSMANARAALASRQLRGVVVHEVQKLRAAEPDLDSWKRDAVVNMLSQKAVDPTTIAPPSFSVSPNASPSVTPKPRGWVSHGPTPAPSPTTAPAPQKNPPYPPNGEPTPPAALPAVPETAAGKPAARRGTQIRDDYMPSKSVIDTIRAELPMVTNDQLQYQHAKFLDHWRKTGKPMKDWDACWRNWMRTAGERGDFARTPNTAPNGIGKPTLKAAGYQAIAEQLIAEMEKP